MFPIGSLLYDRLNGTGPGPTGLLLKWTYVYLTMLLIALAFERKLDTGHNMEILVVMFMALMCTVYFSQAASQTSFSLRNVDTILGDLSYPMFLLPWLSMALVPFVAQAGDIQIDPRGTIVLQILVTVTLAAGIFFLVDRPVQRMRKRLHQPSPETPLADLASASPPGYHLIAP